MVQVLHFTSMVDESYNHLFSIFSGFGIPKIIKICLFLTELLKIKSVVAFLKHSVYTHCGVGLN